MEGMEIMMFRLCDGDSGDVSSLLLMLVVIV
jgi:hypothetical protein